MADKLNWQAFRSSHKLPASKKEYKSEMWSAYKSNDKEAYVKAAEEAEFEIPDEVKGWLEGPKTELEKLKGVKEEPVEEANESEEETKEEAKTRFLELHNNFCFHPWPKTFLNRPFKVTNRNTPGNL